MKDYRGLIIGNHVAKSWRNRWEEMGGFKDLIPERKFEAKAKDGKGEILIYEQIGESFWDGSGVSAKKFADELKALGDVSSIDVRINSPGGVVTDADAIYSQLFQHKAKINVFIDGIAASSASFIAMAGDTISIAEHAKFMIHNAWGMAVGNAAELRELADVMDVFDSSIRVIYQKRTGQPDAKLRDWMDAETWFTGQQAVDEKFATAMIPAKGDGKKAEDTSGVMNIAELMKMRLDLAKAL